MTDKIDTDPSEEQESEQPGKVDTLINALIELLGLL